MAPIKSLTLCLNKNQDEDSAFTDSFWLYVWTGSHWYRE